jgi:hypothetical protein
MAIGAGSGNGRTCGYCFIAVYHVEDYTRTIINSVLLKLHIPSTFGYLEEITLADRPHSN